MAIVPAREECVDTAFEILLAHESGTSYVGRCMFHGCAFSLPTQGIEGAVKGVGRLIKY